MSSEQLADGVNPLDAELAATWDVLKGYSGRDTDLGIARRFGGSAAAYSLRDIGAMNQKVVKVRRDSGETSDSEEDFSANQVQSGALEDWVNGKLESTLPADVATAAAAYSLRKAKKTYSGDAVRIRRSSDDTEVNVAFDSDSKVSSSSSISVVSGSTTATTLGEFINHSGDFGNFRVDNDWSDNLLAFSSVGKTSFSVEAKSLGSFGSTDTVRVSAPITNIIAEPQASVTKFKTTFTIDSISGEGNGNATDGALYIKGANTPNGNGSWNFHNSPDGAGGDVTFKFTSAGTYTVEGYGEDATDAFNLAFRTFAFIIYSGTKVSVSNVSMEVLNDCGVHTWYDQAGVNNAVQATAANQPQIAENGALLADGIDFDGTDDFLQTSTQVLTGTETGANSMYVVLKQTTGDAGYICGSAATSVGADQIGQSLYGNNNGSYFALSNGNNIDSPERDNITIIQGSTALVSANYSNNNTNTLNKNANSNGYLNGTEAYDFNAGSKFTIGARDGSTATAVLFNGSIQEIIAYNSDQSNNRFKIESNINNYYGLYNDEYEWDDATNTEWQNNVTDGTTTFTANGKDGFTITATGNNISSFKYAITSPSSGINDYYKVSFNVDDPDGLFTSAQLRLTATGAGATAQTIVNGFNELSLRTGASFKYMAINSNGGGSSKTATLSDFKISLIARNGFVETWYDQSGSGNDATQVSAGDQPNIVSNGGIIKNANGNPSLEFDGSGKHLQYGNVTSNINTISSFIYLERTAASGAEIVTSQGSSATTPASRWYTPFFNSAVAYLGYGAAGSTALNLGTVSTFTPTLLSFACGASNVEGFANGTSKGTLTLEDASTTSTTNDDIGKFGTSGGFEYTGRVTEYFIYASKLQSDADTINDEINNHYNIY